MQSLVIALLVSDAGLQTGIATMNHGPMRHLAQLVSGMAGIVHFTMPCSLRWRGAVAVASLSAGLIAVSTVSLLRCGNVSTLASIALEVRAIPFLVGFNGAYAFMSPASSSKGTRQPSCIDGGRRADCHRRHRRRCRPARLGSGRSRRLAAVAFPVAYALSATTRGTNRYINTGGHALDTAQAAAAILAARC